MLKKKIAAAVAAIMTISSLGVVALAEIADGQTYDQLLGNELVEGTFENGVNVGADRWVPKLNIKKVTDNTYGGSAGAVLVDQTASTVYSGFSMKSNRIYHAEAYIKLYNQTTDKAQLVLASKNGENFEPITTTAVKTDVNGTGWTKLEGDFIRNSTTADSADIFCYVELENEKEFYLDNVIIKDTNNVFPTGAELVTLAGEGLKVGKLVAGADGKASIVLPAAPIKKGLQYKLSATVMLDQSSQTENAQAYMSYKAGRTTKSGDPITLDNTWKEAKFVETVISASGSDGTRDITLNITASENDIIYFKGISVQPVLVAEADTAEVTIGSFNTLAGHNSAAVINADADTVALRYFYWIDGVIKKTGHTNSGDITVPSILIDASSVGKTVKLEIEPMNADLIYGEKVTAATVVKAPFEPGEITPTVDSAAGTVTSTFDVTNTSGASKNVAALVAYYNAKDEMIGIGIENKQITDGNTETFNVTVNVEPVTGDYSKLYLLDGDSVSGALALFPLAEEK